MKRGTGIKIKYIEEKMDASITTIDGQEIELLTENPTSKGFKTMYDVVSTGMDITNPVKLAEETAIEEGAESAINYKKLPKKLYVKTDTSINQAPSNPQEKKTTSNHKR